MQIINKNVENMGKNEESKRERKITNVSNKKYIFWSSEYFE